MSGPLDLSVSLDGRDKATRTLFRVPSHCTHRVWIAQNPFYLTVIHEGPTRAELSFPLHEPLFEDYCSRHAEEFFGRCCAADVLPDWGEEA